MEQSKMGAPVQVTQRLTRASLADLAYESLLESIVSGQLAPGTVLTTVGVAEQLDISRTPVAEAFVRLAADGLLEQESYRRAQVKRFTRDDVADIYHMRMLLEPEAAALACAHLTDEGLASLRCAIDHLKGDHLVDWPEQAMATDVLFHDRLAEASGRRLLCEQIGKYRRLVRSFCRMSGQPQNLKQALAEHEAILQALEARNAEGARQAMAHHIEQRLQAVLKTEPWKLQQGADHDT